MNRESFVFYRSFYEAISELNNEQKGVIFDAICGYGLDQKLPDVNGVEKAIFTLIRPQLDANHRKYENGLKGKESGALGGRPKGSKNPKKTPKKPLANPKLTPNVNVNGNVNGNENVNKGGSNYSDEFEEFWKEYPRRIDKKKANKSWLTGIKKTDPSIILAATKQYALECLKNKTETAYIKHPTSWLNGECWNNYNEPTQKLTLELAIDPVMEIHKNQLRLNYRRKEHEHRFKQLTGYGYADISG
jgi:hypothetical protein